jgi:hypothetical protein
MQIIQNTFTQYELTPEELITGYSLSPEQRAVIQNDIAEAAQQKVGLKYDPMQPLLFAQKEAELQGRINILQYMLTRADEALTVDGATDQLATHLQNSQF